jgi:hypothetical protein
MTSKKHNKSMPKKITKEEKEVEVVVPPKVKTDDAMEKLLAKVEALEAKDLENQKQLKMLTEVADKGRVMNYESKNAEKKPFRVKLSVYKEGVIVGWRTVKDELVKHPTTGVTIGEVSEYEIMILNKDGSVSKELLLNRGAFDEAHYKERIECDVVGKKEDFSGNLTFNIKLPDGRVVDVDSRFVN